MIQTALCTLKISSSVFGRRWQQQKEKLQQRLNKLQTWADTNSNTGIRGSVATDKAARHALVLHITEMGMHYEDNTLHANNIDNGLENEMGAQKIG